MQNIGTAPSYASLFMDKLEHEFLESTYLVPSVWRFLDDIVMVWDHSLECLHSFIDALYSFHQTINTYANSSEVIFFLM